MAKQHLKKIPKKMLVVGMFIEEFCGSWMEHPFWKARFLLATEADRKRVLKSAITELWIDTAKGLDISGAQNRECAEQVPQSVALDPVALAPELRPKLTPAKQPSLSMAEELARAGKIVGLARAAVEQMFTEARMGKSISATECRTMVEEIASSVSRNPGALINLARLKSADEYTYMHSVAVCALMIGLARELDWAESDVHEAGMAGLLHDMGKALVPLDVLNKPGRLSDAEFEIVKGHARQGYQLLSEAGSASDAVMDACLHHHEKTDGSGYPDGLKADQISILAKMAAVCDVYDAVTSNRPYKSGWDPAEALRKMAEWCPGHFDDVVFQAFVKSLGVYPTGSLVRLQSKRLAVVVDQTPGALLRPKVKVFFSLVNKVRIQPQVVDLSDPKITERIAAREPPERWHFKDLDRLWQP